MRSIEEIYEKLTAEFQKLSGLPVRSGGDLAVRFYAVAAEMYSLYVQGEWVRGQCFPQTATGENLEMHGALRGIKRREAARAAGKIRFFLEEVREEDVPIEAGTVCLTAGERRFETVEAGVIPAGKSWADVAARAVEAGAEGNAAAGAILYMAVAPAAVSSCVNPEAFAGGRDEENDESLRARVMETYARLANGANAAYYRQAALSFDGVAAVHVVPRSRGIGTVDVVVTTQAGIPEEELLTAVEERLESMREIAVDVKVLPPEKVTVDLDLVVTAAAGYDAGETAERVRAAVSGWFTGERLGMDILRAELVSLMFGLEGVQNCAVKEPAADVAIEETQLPVLGTLTVRTA